MKLGSWNTCQQMVKITPTNHELSLIRSVITVLSSIRACYTLVMMMIQ